MQNSKNFAIASLICGILSIVLPWIPYGYIFAIAAGIVAIVLSVKVRKLNDANKGMATGGLVTGIMVLLSPALLWFVLFVQLVHSFRQQTYFHNLKTHWISASCTLCRRLYFLEKNYVSYF